LVGAIATLIVGAIVGSTAEGILASTAVGPLPLTLVGALAGGVIGAVRPLGLAGPARRDLPTATAGEPAPIGALAGASVRELERPLMIAMTVGVLVGIAAIPVALGVYAALGVRPSLVVIGVAGVAGYVVAVLVMTMLPAFLLPSRSRTALAAHLWLGAREFERALGSRHAARSFPTRPEDTLDWLRSHPETDATRGMHVEIHLMRGDADAAMAVIGRMPADTPARRFERALLTAMVEYQSTGVGDESAARDALASIDDPLDRSMATVALASFDSRRRLAHGDWREPLVQARPAIAGSDAAILARDFGWVNFVTLLRRTWIVPALLIALSFVIGIPVDLAAR
jgi:hypothetical protein